MINNDEYIQRIVQSCAKIMSAHANLFPIARLIELAVESQNINNKNDSQGYVRHAIETRIGLQFIARKIVNAGNVFWLDFDSETMTKNIIKNTLIHYAHPYPMKDHTDTWDNMLKKENLI